MIRIPKNLVDAISNSADYLRKLNAMDLRTQYQENKDHQHLHHTYLMSRMPSTYAAILRILHEMPQGLKIGTVLDIGCGPGTGLWAVREYFDSLISYTGVENDRKFIELAQKLNDGYEFPETEWVKGVYPKNLPEVKADLVLMSYTLGENSPETLLGTIHQVWQNNVSEWLVIVEPGTPKGFATISNIRSCIIENDGYIYAPCKGNYICPLLASDWCHFSVRLERMLLQKQIKNAILPYEDEKFSYLIARKTPVEFDEAETRVVKKPVIRPRHITLDLCSKDPYERITVSKSQKALYRSVKYADWGDSWNKGKADD